MMSMLVYWCCEFLLVIGFLLKKKKFLLICFSPLVLKLHVLTEPIWLKLLFVFEFYLSRSCVSSSSCSYGD